MISPLPDTPILRHPETYQRNTETSPRFSVSPFSRFECLLRAASCVLSLDTALPFATLSLYGVSVMVELGDKLLVTGGYDYNPRWLRGREGCVGTVVRFLWEGSDRKKKLVLDLGDDFSTCEFRGRYLILFLRDPDSDWEDKGVVHVVVGNSIPRDVESIGVASDPKNGFKWIEAAATYKVLRKRIRKNIRFTEVG